MAKKKKKRKKSKKTKKSRKKSRRTPKWSSATRAAFKREKRALINKYNKKARGR